MDGLLIENGKVQGVRAKFPFSFLSPATKTVEGGEGGAGGLGSVSRGGQGQVRAGKKEREGPSTYLGPWLEQGGSGAGRPREAGVAGGGACGGGVARPEKGLGVAVELVGVEGVAEVPFMGEERRWRGSEAVVAASEQRVAPLMTSRAGGERRRRHCAA